MCCIVLPAAVGSFQIFLNTVDTCPKDWAWWLSNDGAFRPAARPVAAFGVSSCEQVVTWFWDLPYSCTVESQSLKVSKFCRLRGVGIQIGWLLKSAALNAGLKECLIKGEKRRTHSCSVHIGVCPVWAWFTVGDEYLGYRLICTGTMIICNFFGVNLRMIDRFQRMIDRFQCPFQERGKACLATVQVCNASHKASSWIAQTARAITMTTRTTEKLETVDCTHFGLAGAISTWCCFNFEL